MKSKFDTKNPLKKQHVVTYTLEFRGPRENKRYCLYKKCIGELALTARGTVLPYWFTSTAFRARVKRAMKGIKKVTVGKINTSVEEYYKLMLDELNNILEADKYWVNRENPIVQKLWSRVRDVLHEISQEDIDVEIPELVSYFYNSQMPSSVQAFRDLNTKDSI